MTFNQNLVQQRRQVVVPSDLAQRSRLEGLTFPLFSLLRQTVDLNGKTVIENKAFVDCHIEGPAVLLPLSGVKFDGCNLGKNGGDIRNLLLRPVGAKVVGAISLRDCQFERCTFFGVGFTGTDAFLNHLIEALGGQPTA